jgi:hypothetical protein
MSTTQFNKEYLNFTKQEVKKWHLYIGGTPEASSSGISGTFDWGRDVNFLYRIKENDINFITERNDWARRIVSSPWRGNLSDSNHKLIFNPINNIAYLCVSDNLDNRSDSSIRGKNFSFFIPSHPVGIETYEDGYSWFALFTIDPDKLDLVTKNYIPVPSLESFSINSTSASLDYVYFQKCGSNYNKTQGTCCLYNKSDTIDGTGITYDKGELSYTKLVCQCYQCYEIAKKLNYQFVFHDGITLPPLYPTCTPCDCQINIKSAIDDLVENISTVNPSSSYRQLYESYLNWYPYKQGIFSVFINLESLTDSQRTISYENPQVTFESITGTGALARLKTIPVPGGYYVNGIELISRGSNYGFGNAKPVIENLETHILNNKIEINITPEEFPENPSIMLSNMKTCIKSTINNTMINDDVGSDLNEFTKYGIVKDVRLRSNTKKASESLNDNQFQILRATTKLTLTPSKTNEFPRENPYLNLSDKQTVTFSDTDNKKGTKVYFNYNTDSTGVCGARMELITKDYDNFVKGDLLKVTDTFSYVIDEINKPDVIYGSGQPVLSNDFYVKFPSADTNSYKPEKALTFTIIKS